MFPIISRLTAASLLLVGSAALSGCIVAGPRPAARVRVVESVHVEHGRYWAPGYWSPRRVWVGGGWRYR